MLTHTVLFPLWHLSWLNSTVHIILFFSWINYPLVLYLYWICFSFRGEVSILETKNGARIPHQYTAGDVLHSKSPIFAYTSGKEFLIINFSFIFYYFFFTISKMYSIQLEKFIMKMVRAIWPWCGGSGRKWGQEDDVLATS